MTGSPGSSGSSGLGLAVVTGAAGAADALVDRLQAWVLVQDPARWAGQSPSERRRALAAAARSLAPLVGDGELEGAVMRVLARLSGLGPLEPLLADPAVTEVMVNGGGHVWIERAGALVRTPIALDEPTVLHLIERIVAPLGLRVDRSSPLVDARLPDGSRVNAIVRPVAVDGPCLTIRRFGVAAIPLAAFAGAAVVRLLQDAVRARCNIVISGGTGAGKTTLLNALVSVVPPDERLITIEDTAELRLDAPHVVRLEARPANAEGQGGRSISELVRNALRMRPDRLVVGEVRGGEALDMLQAMNTGHEGSLSTCHANSPADALRRLETMALQAAIDLPLAAVREQVQASVDLVVQVSRGAAGRRRISAVAEVVAGLGGGPPGTVALVHDDRVVRPLSRGRVEMATTPPVARAVS